MNTSIKFIILIHPHEAKRSVATGRMAHLSLPNSLLIQGIDFTLNSEVNRIISDENNISLVLYPGKKSKNLSAIGADEKRKIFGDGKSVTIFVIDGTWRTAKKILRRSENISQLDQICFKPERPSGFKVRKQPKSHCYSTLEAISTVLGIMGNPDYQSLLNAFSYMVKQQLEFIERKASPRFIP